MRLFRAVIRFDCLCRPFRSLVYLYNRACSLLSHNCCADSLIKKSFAEWYSAEIENVSCLNVWFCARKFMQIPCPLVVTYYKTVPGQKLSLMNKSQGVEKGPEKLYLNNYYSLVLLRLLLNIWWLLSSLLAFLLLHLPCVSFCCSGQWKGQAPSVDLCYLVPGKTDSGSRKV